MLFSVIYGLESQQGSPRVNCKTYGIEQGARINGELRGRFDGEILALVFYHISAAVYIVDISESQTGIRHKPIVCAVGFSLYIYLKTDF